jgi:hypothetical protein
MVPCALSPLLFGSYVWVTRRVDIASRFLIFSAEKCGFYAKKRYSNDQMVKKELFGC